MESIKKSSQAITTSQVKQHFYQFLFNKHIGKMISFSGHTLYRIVSFIFSTTLVPRTGSH